MDRIEDPRRSGRIFRRSAVVPLVVALGALGLTAGAGIAAQAAPPNNTAEPTISGRAEQDRTLNASNGSWTGTGSITYAYQWVRCGADGGRPDGGNCAIVSGATSRQHRLTSSDVGFRMRIRVTASNADGSRTVASNPTGTVVGPPVNTSTPVVRGTMLVGSGRDGRTGYVDWPPGDLVLVPLAALQHAGRRMRLDRRRDGPELPAHVLPTQPQDALQRHSAELCRLDHGHLGRVRSRDGAARRRARSGSRAARSRFRRRASRRTTGSSFRRSCSRRTRSQAEARSSRCACEPRTRAGSSFAMRSSSSARRPGSRRAEIVNSRRPTDGSRTSSRRTETSRSRGAATTCSSS